VKDLVRQDLLNRKLLKSLQKDVQRQKEIINDLTVRLKQEESRHSQQDAREAALLRREQDLREREQKVADARAGTTIPYENSPPSSPISVHDDEDPQTLVDRLKQRERQMRAEIDALKSSPPFTPVGNATDLLNGFVSALNSVAASMDRHHKPPQPSPVDSLVITMKQKMLLNLPKFDGALREWAFFEREYNRTTELGEFSPEQNIVRLREALTGEAYNLVRDKILFSYDPAPVMAALKQTFGDPDRLVVVLTAELAQLPKIESETSNQLRKFALAVSNFVVNMHAIKRERELLSTFTLTVLEEKLSYWHRCQWIDIKRAKETVNIEDFSKFLTQKMQDMPYIEPSSLSTESSRAKRVHINQYELDSDSESDRTLPSCAGCDGHHKLTNCKEFKALSPNRKLDFVLENNICVCCLSATHRSRDCPDFKKCEVEECRFSHHKILHGAKSKNYYKKIYESSNRSTNRSSDSEETD
jgi:Protein of unknown function (DUF1759)